MVSNQSGEAGWIRVGLDTGGIAAGADRLFEDLTAAVARRGDYCRVERVGSYGYAFADPLVEVQAPGCPKVLYGKLDENDVEPLLAQHMGAGKLLDDHVIGYRDFGDRINGPTQVVLLQDSGAEVDKERMAGFQQDFAAALAKMDAEQVQVVRALDLGIYDEGMVVQLLPSGVCYTNVLRRDIERIIQTSIVGNSVVADLHHEAGNPQVRLVLRNCGVVDPESLDSARAAGVYAAIGKVLAEKAPEQLIEQIKASGLRGRGGAGFPTGVKWQLTRQPQADHKYVICNADEGDPGAFMDRSVLEGDPHSVLEGLMLAAYAIGADKGYFYIRAEYPLAVRRVEMAIEQARAAGLLGRDILGSGWDFDAEVRLGAGAFVCGEETALIASLEGKRGSPMPRPPFPSVKGLWGKPTCINNVETLAAVAWIVNNGASAYAAYGVGDSCGTKVFAVTGKVAYPQLVEVPLGTPLRRIVYDICGGVQDAVPIKGVQTGGPSGGIIPEQHLETAVTYENLQQLGSIMGSGGMLIMDENDCMVDVALFYLKFCVDESCGKCAPCRVGGYQLQQLLLKISRGRGSMDDLEQIQRICNAMKKASLCGLGQTAPNPILSSLRYFKDEYIAYIEGGSSYARKRKRALSEGKPLQPANPS